MRTGYAIALWSLAPDGPGSVQGVRGAPERSGEGLRLRRFPSLSASRVALILMLAASAVGVQASTPSQARAMSIAQVDGGPHYYGQFSNPLPDDPDFFPVAVWGSYNHTQQNRDRDAAAGLNTYLWAADSAFMSEIRSDGRFHVIQDEGSRSGVGSRTAGWLLGDEIDMTQGPSACPSAINSIKSGLPRDGRLRFANYGKGVLNWGAVGYNGHNDASSACFVNAQDVTSADLYWFTDPYQLGDPQSGQAWGYGWNVERMRAMDARSGGRQPIWGFVEVGHPFTNGGTITPVQARAAVWHSLIAGARGIIYFQHSFGGPCPAHHALRDTDACQVPMQTMIHSVNAQIKSLAPVLNSPTVRSGWSQGAGTTAMVKWVAAKKKVQVQDGEEEEMQEGEGQEGRQEAVQLQGDKEEQMQEGEGALLRVCRRGRIVGAGEVLPAVRR